MYISDIVVITSAAGDHWDNSCKCLCIDPNL